MTFRARAALIVLSVTLFAAGVAAMPQHLLTVPGEAAIFAGGMLVAFALSVALWVIWAPGSES